LVFDLIGALYSHLSVGDPPSAWILPVIGLLLVIGSYVAYRRQMRERNGAFRIASGQDARPARGIAVL
jgi:hypothetical protein